MRVGRLLLAALVLPAVPWEPPSATSGSWASWASRASGGLGARAAAQVLAPDREDVPLVDLLEIVVLEHRVVALDAEGGGQSTERLRLGERILWTGSRGRVGLVLTDQRLLAAGVGIGGWRALEWERSEVRPSHATLGDRVALVVTSRRVLGFNGVTGVVSVYDVGPREKLLASRVGRNVIVVVTDREALGLSPSVGGFLEFPMQLKERLSSVDVRSNLATVTTDRRILIFRGPAGSWAERRLELSDQG